MLLDRALEAIKVSFMNMPAMGISAVPARHRSEAPRGIPRASQAPRGSYSPRRSSGASFQSST